MNKLEQKQWIALNQRARLSDMGINHRGTGGQVPPESGVGDANANSPPHNLSCFKI